MKKSTYFIYSLLAGMLMLATTATAQTWNFNTVSAADKANLAADAAAWEHESSSSNDRYKNKTVYTAEPLMANGAELEFTRGLMFTIGASDAVRVDIKGKRMAMNKALTITLKDMKAGNKVTMKCKTSKSGTARGVNVTNLTPESGSFNSTSADDQTNVGVVAADGDVTLTNTGGLYVYTISVTDGSGTPGPSPDSDDHSAVLNTAVSQAQLTTTGSVMKYYNTADLAGIAIDRKAGTVTVTPQSGEWTDVFTRSVSNIAFSNASQTSAGAEITTGGVEITEAGGSSRHI